MLDFIHFYQHLHSVNLTTEAHMRKRQLSWKQRLALSVNAVPRDPIYPYGKLRCIIAGNREARRKRAMKRYCNLDVIKTLMYLDKIHPNLRYCSLMKQASMVIRHNRQAI